MPEKVLNSRIKQKSDLSTFWSANNPILLNGEIGIESDTKRFKIGDGINHWNDLKYFGTTVKIDDSTVEELSFSSDPQGQIDTLTNSLLNLKFDTEETSGEFTDEQYNLIASGNHKTITINNEVYRFSDTLSSYNLKVFTHIGENGNEQFVIKCFKIDSEGSNNSHSWEISTENITLDLNTLKADNNSIKLSLDSKANAQNPNLSGTVAIQGTEKVNPIILLTNYLNTIGSYIQMNDNGSLNFGSSLQVLGKLVPTISVEDLMEGINPDYTKSYYATFKIQIGNIKIIGGATPDGEGKKTIYFRMNNATDTDVFTSKVYMLLNNGKYKPSSTANGWQYEYIDNLTSGYIVQITNGSYWLAIGE